MKFISPITVRSNCSPNKLVKCGHKPFYSSVGLRPKRSNSSVFEPTGRSKLCKFLSLKWRTIV
ncbi:hypothetical protein DPMN_180915 [Dreissena polymorpha]|uniref:Uncharacterized protein n=1 Tax=Dreissena polymorpha TaxID=45954 RepID=A0A9D4DBC4_DREPO|nr:hypothetical protein DPMN_180915 [Dreissena polymorpha]